MESFTEFFNEFPFRKTLLLICVTGFFFLFYLGAFLKVKFMPKQFGDIEIIYKSFEGKHFFKN